MAALTAGALAGATGAASQSVLDGYNGLKSHLKKRLGSSAQEPSALDSNDAGSAPWQESMADELRKAAIGTQSGDDELATRAVSLLKEIEMLRSQSADAYDIDIRGSQIGNVGRVDRLTQTFGSLPRDED